MTTSDPKPYLTRWPGNKTEQADRIIAALLPPGSPDPALYVEPFLGSGAVFHRLALTGRLGGARVLLSDGNQDLVFAWWCLTHETRPTVEYVNDLLSEMRKEPYETYRTARRIDAQYLDVVRRAARFLALQRTSFNGLWRVNRNGGFNVPPDLARCATAKPLDPVDVERTAALYRRHIRSDDSLSHRTWEAAIYAAIETRRGCALSGPAVIYLDPPYVPRTGSSVRYVAEGFAGEDQIKLAETASQLIRAGYVVGVSQSDTPRTRELYPPSAGWTIHEIPRRERVAAKVSARGTVTDLLMLGKGR